jgi:rod shape-determining protein MreD
MLHVLLLLEGAQAVALGVRLAAGAEFPGWSLAAGPAFAALLWPVVTWVLLLPQRRPALLDEHRSL